MLTTVIWREWVSPHFCDHSKMKFLGKRRLNSHLKLCNQRSTLQSILLCKRLHGIQTPGLIWPWGPVHAKSYWQFCTAEWTSTLKWERKSVRNTDSPPRNLFTPWAPKTTNCWVFQLGWEKELLSITADKLAREYLMESVGTEFYTFPGRQNCTDMRFNPCRSS